MLTRHSIAWLVPFFTLALLPGSAARAASPVLELEITQALAGDRPGDAVASLETAIAAETDGETTEDLLRRLAGLYLQLDRPVDAATTLEKLASAQAQRLGPRATDVAATWQQSAEIWQQLGERSRALEAYVNAIRIDAANGLAPETNPLDATTDALIAEEPSARMRQQLQAQKRSQIDLSAAVGEREVGAAHALVRIYYATNRALTDSPRLADVYTGDRGPVTYGTAEVSIPDIHVAGALEAPDIFSFDVVEDPDKHVMLRAITPADKAATFAAMREHLAEKQTNEAFVFVHGFNTSFVDAVRRTAQIAYDMDFDGLPILYSWPSQGSILGYLADGAVVQLSGRYLTRFLDDVVADTGATRIHLIAHSMGNRALTEALELFALRHAGEPPAFDQVLFTAPDLDAGLFANMVQTIRPAVGRMTLYTSKNDWALRASHQLNGGAPRAGEGTAGIPMPQDIDSIDMSVLGADMLAHSYFANDTSALTDILSLFWRDAPPDRRCGMTASPVDTTSAEWSLEPTLCDGNAMLSALRLLRGQKIGNLSDALATIESAFPEAEPEQRMAIEAALERLFRS
ncbi:alpha/beta hydrolase [Devosia sp.]|uniref:alpha/beta hydrolase n=1 Tax=Devosia sp. TaxID=1871048 RepID=UPI003A934746